MKWIKANWQWIALAAVGLLHLWQLLRMSYQAGRFQGIADMMIEQDRERRELQLASMTTVVKHIAPPAAPAGASEPAPTNAT